MEVREQADCWIQVTSLGDMMITGASWIGTTKRKSFGRYSDPKGFLTNALDLAFYSADSLVCSKSATAAHETHQSDCFI
jgi:hypothetical protein